MKCFFEHFVTESRRVTLSEVLSTALADLPGNTSKVYAYMYRCYPMTHEFFWVFRVQFGVLSQHMYRECPIHVAPPPAIVWQLYLVMGSLCIFLRHLECI